MPEVEQTEEAPDNLRAMLESAHAEYEKAAAPEPEVKATTEAPEPAAQTEDKSERARGPDGKFIKADETEEKEPVTEPEVRAEPETTTEAKPEVKVEDVKPAAELPAHWAPKDRDAFKALAPEGQRILKDMIDRQEKDYNKKTQGVAEFRREYEPVDQLFAPHRDMMKQRGYTPRGLIEGWFNVEQNLTDPQKAPAVIAGLVKGYNINPSVVARVLGLQQPQGQEQQTEQLQTGEQPQQQQLPPELMSMLQRLEQRQNDIERERQDTMRRTALEREQQKENEIQQFKTAVDEKGNLLHPHYDEVEDAMLLLAQGHIARKQALPELLRLYEDAIWANPSTREKLRTAEMQSAEQKRKDEARAKAAKAAKAGSSVTGAPGSGQSQLKPVERSLREELEAAAADIEVA